MCAYFYLGYVRVLSDISDDGRTLQLLRFNVIHLRNIGGFCFRSANRSYANAFVKVLQHLCLQRMSGVVSLERGIQ